MGDHIDVSVPVGEPYATMFEEITVREGVTKEELKEELAQALVKPTRDVIHNSYTAQPQE